MARGPPVSCARCGGCILFRHAVSSRFDSLAWRNDTAPRTPRSPPPLPPPLTEQEATYFEGLRRGFTPKQEERAWSDYSKAWKRGKPDVSKAEAVTLAKDHGVSTAGDTRAILSRISRSAERERAKGFGMFDDIYGDEGDSEDEFGSDDEIMLPLW